MPGPTSHTYDSKRLRLHYLQWGDPDAPPLLLIHGNRDHAHSWDWTAERLQDRYRVIAPDLRGHGDSQWAVGSAYAVAEYVYDIAQLVHQQHLSRLRIIAHSLGGNVALRYAGAFPEVVHRLVAVDGSGGVLAPPTAQESAPQRLRAWVEGDRALAGRSPRRYASLDEALLRMQETNPHLSADQARHLTVHGADQNEDGTYSWKFDNYVHNGHMLDPWPDAVLELWGNITCPVLHVTGSESFHLQWTDPDTLVAAFRDARHVIVEGAGHWVQHDQLEAFLDLVENFLP